MAEKTYVYLLSDYHEYGAENVTATLDRGRLIELIDENWPLTELPEARSVAWRAEAKTKLAELLIETDAGLASRGSHNLQAGWGGIQLHVVRLK